MCGFRFILQLDILHAILYSIYYIQYLHTICNIVTMYCILNYIYEIFYIIRYIYIYIYIYVRYDVPYNTYYKLDGYVLCNIWLHTTSYTIYYDLIGEAHTEINREPLLVMWAADCIRWMWIMQDHEKSKKSKQSKGPIW